MFSSSGRRQDVSLNGHSFPIMLFVLIPIMDMLFLVLEDNPQPLEAFRATNAEDRCCLDGQQPRCIIFWMDETQAAYQLV